jgi:hypothetical protein
MTDVLADEMKPPARLQRSQKTSQIGVPGIIFTDLLVCQ